MNIFIWHPGTIELGLRCIVWHTDFSRDACLCFFKVFICLFNSLSLTEFMLLVHPIKTVVLDVFGTGKTQIAVKMSGT